MTQNKAYDTLMGIAKPRSGRDYPTEAYWQFMRREARVQNVYYAGSIIPGILRPMGYIHELLSKGRQGQERKDYIHFMEMRQKAFEEATRLRRTTLIMVLGDSAITNADELYGNYAAKQMARLREATDHHRLLRVPDLQIAEYLGEGREAQTLFADPERELCGAYAELTYDHQRPQEDHEQWYPFGSAGYTQAVANQHAFYERLGVHDLRI